MKQFLLTQNASKIGLTQNSLDKFKDAIFNYDPMFRDSYLNLAQMIVVNLYKVKYNENTNINKKLSSLTPILKLFSTKFIHSHYYNSLPNYENYKLICTVRNPYSKFVSLFKYLLRLEKKVIST